MGFEVPIPHDEEGVPPLGYSACGTIPPFLRDDTSGLGGFGGSGGFRTWEPAGNGVERTLHELRRATANLADTGWADDGSGPATLEDPAATSDALATGDPGVRVLVVTGPLDAVAEVVGAAEADHADLLEIDFARGAPDPCG